MKEMELGQYKSRAQKLEEEVAHRGQSLTVAGDTPAEAAEEKVKDEGYANVDWAALADLVGDNIVGKQPTKHHAYRHKQGGCCPFANARKVRRGQSFIIK